MIKFEVLKIYWMYGRSIMYLLTFDKELIKINREIKCILYYEFKNKSFMFPGLRRSICKNLSPKTIADFINQNIHRFRIIWDSNDYEEIGIGKIKIQSIKLDILDINLSSESWKRFFDTYIKEKEEKKKNIIKHIIHSVLKKLRIRV